MATILIVDDDPDTSELLARCLAVSGHHPVRTSDAQEALAVLSQNPPDLALLNLASPAGDDLVLLRALRNAPGRAGGVPVVLCAGPARDPADARLAFGPAGATEVLFRNDGVLLDLVDAVRRHVGTQSRPAAAARSAPVLQRAG